MSSHILVSFESPPLILGVETNQQIFFGHSPRDLYKVPLAVLYGPSTNQDSIEQAIRIAVFQRQSTELITKLYEFGISRSTLISVYPCTPVRDLPISCVFVLNEIGNFPSSNFLDDSGTKAACSASGGYVSVEQNKKIREKFLRTLKRARGCHDWKLLHFAPKRRSASPRYYSANPKTTERPIWKCG